MQLLPQPRVKPILAEPRAIFKKCSTGEKGMAVLSLMDRSNKCSTANYNWLKVFVLAVVAAVAELFFS